MYMENLHHHQHQQMHGVYEFNIFIKNLRKHKEDNTIYYVNTICDCGCIVKIYR